MGNAHHSHTCILLTPRHRRTDMPADMHRHMDSPQMCTDAQKCPQLCTDTDTPVDVHRHTDTPSYTQMLTHAVTHTLAHLCALTPGALARASAQTHTADGALIWHSQCTMEAWRRHRREEPEALFWHQRPGIVICVLICVLICMLICICLLICMLAFGAHLQACFRVHSRARLHPFATSHCCPIAHVPSGPREQWPPHQGLHRCPAWAPSAVPPHHRSSQAHSADWTSPNSPPRTSLTSPALSPHRVTYTWDISPHLLPWSQHHRLQEALRDTPARLQCPVPTYSTPCLASQCFLEFVIIPLSVQYYFAGLFPLEDSRPGLSPSALLTMAGGVHLGRGVLGTVGVQQPPCTPPPHSCQL